MKLVFVTQTLDPEHGSLAQTLDLVNALAARSAELVVLAREDRWGDAPANVRVLAFDAKGKVARGIAFERALARSLPHADAVLVHMVPTFLALAAPLARVRRVPLFLWYTHWHASRSLRVATKLATRVLSVESASFPLATAKLVPIGHAIDVNAFSAPPAEERYGPLRLLALGRTARWKGLATLIEAFQASGITATLEVRGPSLTDDERAHRRELEELADGDNRISIAPAVRRAEVPDVLRGADVVVSPAEPRAGATLDKAVYEAAACARPVVTTNAALAPFLEGLPLQLLARPGDVEGLAGVLRDVVNAAPAVRAATGAELRSRVVEQHSLEHWADAVVALVREVRSARGG
jgi:glycosyltransferase involved in cell wall biosynthesis